jgi:transcriptional regulator with XRE-family HTH domain
MWNIRKALLTEYDYGINQRVIHIRKYLQYSQGKFAEGLKLSRSFQGEIKANHRKINDRLIKMISLTYGVSENWLKTGIEEMFDIGNDHKLEQIVRNFNKMDDLLQDYVLKYLDWLVEYYEKKPKQ